MKNLGVKTFIYPQPVLILGTYDANQKVNVMNAAWGGMYDYDKIFISISDHKTTDNLKVTNAFTVGIGDVKNVIPCDYVGIVSGRTEPNKFAKTGWTSTKSSFVNAPIVNELPVTLECEVYKFDENEGILIGTIKNVCCQDEVVGTNGLPDISKFTPITYEPATHKYIALGKVVGQAFSDGKKIK